MKRTLVRYRTKSERTKENEQLIRQVFQELHTRSPDGVRYLALKLADGTFIHLVANETKDGANPIPKLDAFRPFQSGIKERCLDPPQQGHVTIVGNYRMLGE